MKVIISRLELVSLIGKIQNVVSPRPVIPILANVLIEAQADQIILSTTDLTVSMRAFASAKVVQEGGITLPAKRFFQLVRELTTPQIEIHAETPETAFINAGSSHFKIQGMHKAEFPSLPDLADGVHLAIGADKFKEMLARTAFSAARDDSRQVLNGILFSKTEGEATCIGTDGKRLAKIQIPIENGTSSPRPYLVPLKAVEEMIKILDTKEEKCNLTFMPDKIALETGSTTLITKLLAGQFPDVTRVIPEKRPNPINLHREELISLLRQVSLFTTEASSSVRFTFSDGALHLSATSGEIGEGVVSMPVNYGGEKLEIAFNPHYFLDILRHSKDETVQFSISNAHNPGLITDSSNASFVLMPMRLDAN
ncbi:MAG: DNA polymerase III subunit beta [Chlamydiales bacterium]|nr:DNA polymerase III subunit beta [Chlamydiales bacterium]